MAKLQSATNAKTPLVMVKARHRALGERCRLRDVDPRSVPLRRLAGERPQSLGLAYCISPQAHLGCEAGKGVILPGRK